MKSKVAIQSTSSKFSVSSVSVPSVPDAQDSDRSYEISIAGADGSGESLRLWMLQPKESSKQAVAAIAQGCSWEGKDDKFDDKA